MIVMIVKVIIVIIILIVLIVMIVLIVIVLIVIVIASLRVFSGPQAVPGAEEESAAPILTAWAIKGRRAQPPPIIV